MIEVRFTKELTKSCCVQITSLEKFSHEEIVLENNMCCSYFSDWLLRVELFFLQTGLTWERFLLQLEEKGGMEVLDALAG